MVVSHRSVDDRGRFAQWVGEHGRAVRGFIWAMVRRSDVADDLLQEVFRRAWQARRHYRENGSARAYLLKIADRLVCDRARKTTCEVNVDAQAWERCEPASRAGDPSITLAEEEAKQQLAAALDALSPGQRRVLLLRYYGDLSFAEIAQVMNCPLNTALSHCHRGLIALRRQLVENAE